VLSYGVEGLGESIHSSNLGIHSRDRGSGYVFHDLRSVRRYSLSAGIREEVYGAHEVATSPSLSGAAWVSAKFKLRASASRAFRLPSYTDLYYASPSTVGNPNLKPESATSYEAGQHIAVSFSALHGQYASPENIVTEYTFNYPVYDGVVEWRGTVTKNVMARTRIGVVERVAQSPYAIWDAAAGYGTGHVRPFLQLTNITSTVYREIPLVAMPKRGVVCVWGVAVTEEPPR